MVVKLTPTRRKHLEAVRDHDIWRYYEWGGGHRWAAAWGSRRSVDLSIRPSTMEWLVDNGLIRLEVVGVTSWNAPYRAVLTDAGRKALEVE